MIIILGGRAYSDPRCGPELSALGSEHTADLNGNGKGADDQGAPEGAFDPDLSKVVAAWPKLARAARLSILSMVDKQSGWGNT